MAASLTVRPIRLAGAEAKRFTIDCTHGTTVGDYLSPAGWPALDEHRLIRLLIAKHERAEHCGCATALLEQVI